MQSKIGFCICKWISIIWVSPDSAKRHSQLSPHFLLHRDRAIQKSVSLPSLRCAFAELVTAPPTKNRMSILTIADTKNQLYNIIFHLTLILKCNNSIFTIHQSILYTLRYSELSYFYGFWQLSVCLFAFLGLIAIWYHLGRKQRDNGQIFLALSILCWSLTGGVEVYFSFKDLSIDATTNLLDVWKSVLSLLNSLFILISLSWFRYLPKFLENIIKSKTWLIIIGLPFIFSLLPTLSKLFTERTNGIISELDVYYSTLTLIILGIVLWESFSRRRLKLLAILSTICILITFVAQLYKLTNSDINQILLSAIFKSCLIMIFFALALSWVKDLSETLSVAKGRLSLRLKRQKLNNHKWEYLACVGGIFNIQEKEISISKTNYTLLEKFVASKLQETDGWLEIKPKRNSRDGRVYDINDYNEVKRLLHGLLDGLFGKATWSKEQHEIPLKDALFEISKNRDRKIRLSVSAENLELIN